MFLNKINKYRKVEFQVKKTGTENGALSDGQNIDINSGKFVFRYFFHFFFANFLISLPQSVMACAV